MKASSRMCWVTFVVVFLQRFHSFSSYANHLITLPHKATGTNTVSWLCFDPAVLSVLSHFPHIQSTPCSPKECPPSLTLAFNWSTLYQLVCACQCVTPGWCPSLRPLGPFWLCSTLCLPNHLGAGYGNELLTTAGQPVPHNPRPALCPPPPLPTCCWLISMAMRQEFVFSHVFAASQLPPPAFIFSASQQPIRGQLEEITWSGTG